MTEWILRDENGDPILDENGETIEAAELTGRVAMMLVPEYMEVELLNQSIV